MKKTLLIVAIALIMTVGLVSLVGAHGNKEKMNHPKITTEMKEKWEGHKTGMKLNYEEMQNIMGNGTYGDLKIFMENNPEIAKKKADYITEENFAKFQEIYKLKQAGDYEGIKEMKKELGNHEKFGFGMKKDFHSGIKDECPFRK